MLRIVVLISLTVSAYISLMYLALLVRAFMGVFSDGGGALASFVFTVTEPVLDPIRRVFDRLDMFKDTPVDASVIAALLLFLILSFILPAI